jgi:hypothetical protein
MSTAIEKSLPPVKVRKDTPPVLSKIFPIAPFHSGAGGGGGKPNISPVAEEKTAGKKISFNIFRKKSVDPPPPDKEVVVFIKVEEDESEKNDDTEVVQSWNMKTLLKTTLQLPFMTKNIIQGWFTAQHGKIPGKTPENYSKQKSRTILSLYFLIYENSL